MWLEARGGPAEAATPRDPAYSPNYLEGRSPKFGAEVPGVTWIDEQASKSETKWDDGGLPRAHEALLR